MTVISALDEIGTDQVDQPVRFDHELGRPVERREAEQISGFRQIDKADGQGKTAAKSQQQSPAWPGALPEPPRDLTTKRISSAVDPRKRNHSVRTTTGECAATSLSRPKANSALTTPR